MFMMTDDAVCEVSERDSSAQALATDGRPSDVSGCTLPLPLQPAGARGFAVVNRPYVQASNSRSSGNNRPPTAARSSCTASQCFDRCWTRAERADRPRLRPGRSACATSPVGGPSVVCTVSSAPCLVRRQAVHRLWHASADCFFSLRIGPVRRRSAERGSLARFEVVACDAACVCSQGRRRRPWGEVRQTGLLGAASITNSKFRYATLTFQFTQQRWNCPQRG